MGTYIYALSTKLKKIGDIEVGVAQFRYKDCGEIKPSYHNRMCGRRVEHFENNPEQIPKYFIYQDSEAGEGVFELPQGRVVFTDGIRHIKVGTLVKTGKEWSIDFLDPVKTKPE